MSFGRGFALLQGVPVERYTRQESVTAYFGIGAYLGKPVPQNKKGHLVGHIKVRMHLPLLVYALHAWRLRLRPSWLVHCMHGGYCLPACLLHHVRRTRRATGWLHHPCPELNPAPPPPCLLQDIGHDPKDPLTRLYATAAAQPWHNDAADIVGECLSCLHQQVYRHAYVHSATRFPQLSKASAQACTGSPLMLYIYPGPYTLACHTTQPRHQTTIP